VHLNFEKIDCSLLIDLTAERTKNKSNGSYKIWIFVVGDALCDAV